MEKVYSRVVQKENLNMWGELYISRPGQAVVGWLVNSCSVNGAPYWQGKIHWYDKGENKLHSTYLNLDFRPTLVRLTGEDTEIEPERAKFIRETVKQWETEWLKEEAEKI
jgi:hypothetical protein